MIVAHPQVVRAPSRRFRFSPAPRSAAWDIVHGYADPAPAPVRLLTARMEDDEPVGRDPSGVLASVLAMLVIVALGVVVAL